jgi:hypothetical protein
MNAPLLPGTPISPSRVQGAGGVASPYPDPAWEYRVCIAFTDTPAQKAAHDLVLQGLSRRGWILHSESQGVFHFKRLKR